MKIEVRNPFFRKREVTEINTPSLTQQCFAEECDINNIIARSINSGVPISEFASRVGSFGDVSKFGSLQEVLAFNKAAMDSFNSLSAQVRERFDNDPNKLILFLQNEKNRDEAIKLGLIESPRLDEVVSDKKIEGSSISENSEMKE